MTVPALNGRMSLEIGRFMDIIIYGVVNTDNEGNRIYRWLVLPNERMNSRSTIQSLNEYAVKQNNKGFIEPSWHTVFNEVRKETDQPMKILLLGNFGVGKSYSIRTLKDCLHLL